MFTTCWSQRNLISTLPLKKKINFFFFLRLFSQQPNRIRRKKRKNWKFQKYLAVATEVAEIILRRVLVTLFHVSSRIWENDTVRRFNSDTRVSISTYSALRLGPILRSCSFQKHWLCMRWLWIHVFWFIGHARRRRRRRRRIVVQELVKKSRYIFGFRSNRRRCNFCSVQIRHGRRRRRRISLSLFSILRVVLKLWSNKKWA